jgi:hypothetical protein
MRRVAGLVAAFVLLIVPATRVEANPTVYQTWSGVLNFPAAPLLFVIAISNDNHKIAAAAVSPYQGGSAIKVDSLSTSGNSLSFAIKQLDVTYQGSIGSSSISGTFTQHGTSIPLVLYPSSMGTTDLAGAWLATLTTPNGSLLLGLRITHDANGQLQATLDSPYQNAFNITVANITAQSGRLMFDLPSINASFQGIIGTNAIGGTFTQNNSSLPLIFTRP